MTLAVLCGSTGNDLDPGAARRLADELTAALAAAGATAVVPVEGLDVAVQLREIARIAADAAEPLLLCADNLVAHPSLLWTLATEPAGRSTALVIPEDGGDLREERGRLVAAADGTTRFLGAISIAPADLPILAAAAARAADHVPAAPGQVGVVRRDAVDLLLPELIEGGLVPIATRVRLLHAERVHAPAELTAARAAVAAVDEDSALLRLAVKEKDDFFTTYAVSTWSPLVTKGCARLGLSPSGVTALSVLFAVAAALAFWQASRPAMIAGGILLYLGFVLDCVDGQLARYTRSFSAFGGWLDTMADRAKEYAVYAGLAAGAERAGLPYAWPLAITAILLQTVRHMTDTWYGALHDEAAARQSVGTAGNADAGGGVGARLSRASNRVQADTGSAAYWLKRIVVFPIGERWALIAVLAAFGNGRIALAAVVIWGLLAAAYTLGLRSLRSLSMRVGVLDTVDTSRHRDDGLLVRNVLSAARAGAPLAATVVAALAALVLVVGLLAGWVPTGAVVGRWVDGGLQVEFVRAAEAAALWLVAAAALVLGAGLPARARHDGPLDWLIPAGLRAAEYLVVVAVGLFGSVPPPVVYLLLFVLALRHYDLTARMEKGAPGATAARAWLGWDGRVALLVLCALGGGATIGESLLAVVVGASFLAGAVGDWRSGGS
ncbi:CDP-alcohol phosphatidyltransferase family protein [Actinoplanes sp. NPDC049668]|uniref:CDP-alcohol phosphatidyltransferase family protein n=1 Tax=unclassified Actinoplanes TaxID=2626549 RepID=UPI00339F59CC